MQVNPIYRPSGRAAEYADYALNIYHGCPHGCTYCYAPAVLRTTRHEFSKCRLRRDIVKSTAKQLAKGELTGRTVFLCFSCDPYPKGKDTTATREVIGLLKEAGCHVRILTKNPSAAVRDFDLLDEGDEFGTTISGAPRSVEPNADPEDVRKEVLRDAKERGIGTWISCEPVYDEEAVFRAIVGGDYVDLFRVGKLNYAPSDIDWAEFASLVMTLAGECKRNVMLKSELRELIA